VIRYALEAIKKICKKYRYMFRSDNLYSEMNYMIENLSIHLLTQGNVMSLLIGFTVIIELRGNGKGKPERFRHSDGMPRYLKLYPSHHRVNPESRGAPGLL